MFILPEDIELTAGAAANHRQFLDMYISQYNKSYLSDLISYRKVVYQRNILLKDIAERRENINQLKAWDEVLIEHAVRIINERNVFIRSINPSALEYFKTFDLEGKLILEYMPRIDRDKDDIKTGVISQLDISREREIRSGLTLVGPHRDRMKITLAGKSVRHYGSRGQKRIVMLSLKLAAADYIAEKSGRDVTLILDEVFAELDKGKSRALMNALKKHSQVFIATAGEFDFNDLAIKSFRVCDGVIEEVTG